MEIGKYIDHTNLKMDAKVKDIEKLCKEAIEYGFESVCVHPYYVPLAKKLLENTNVNVCVVIGFPLGMNTPKTKAFEAVEALELGADEFDMVINVGALKEQNYDLVEKNISTDPLTFNLSGSGTEADPYIINTKENECEYRLP